MASITTIPITLLLFSAWTVVSSPASNPNPVLLARQSEPKVEFLDLPPPEFPSSWSSGLPDFTALPNCDDVNNPSEACGTSLNLSTQGYVYGDRTCSAKQKSFILKAAKDAYTIASYAKGWWSDGANTGGIATAHYYMGPDATSTYKDKIDGPIQRVAKFHEKTNNYIIVHCNDPNKWCSRKIGSKTIGGYAWTTKHWFWWNSHHINMCSPFYTFSDIAGKKRFLRDAFKGVDGSYDKYHKYASDLTWLQVSGTPFLHEMMHTDLIGDPGPHIGDETIEGDKAGTKAYGPLRVWQLANRGIKRGGGAKRASTNSDSYAQMMTAMYWWKTNSQPFPGVPGKKSPGLSTIAGARIRPAALVGVNTVADDPMLKDDTPVKPSNWDNIPIFLNLGDASDPKADWEALYDKAADPSFYPAPTAKAAPEPDPLPSDTVDKSVCGGCPSDST